jgi:hypothetical protein
MMMMMMMMITWKKLQYMGYKNRFSTRKMQTSQINLQKIKDTDILEQPNNK